MAFAYFEGSIRPVEDANLNITTQVVNYGLGAFSGVRAHWNADLRELFMFRPREHFERLREAGRLLLCTEVPEPQAIVEIAVALLRENRVREDAYCRTILYKGDGGLGARLAGVPSDLCMFVQPLPSRTAEARALSIGTSSWRRVPDTSIPARSKLCGAYINAALARSEARLAGFDEALCLDQDGHVAEASGANIFMVRRGRLCSPPVYGDILEGITRRTVIELASREWGLQTQERPIDRSEIYAAEEVFLCGTAVGIAAVGAVDGRAIGDGLPGPVTARLADRYRTIVRGDAPDWRSRCHPVYGAAGDS